MPGGAAVTTGRAYVVPASTGNVGSGESGNVNNFSANARVRSSTVLVATSAADGGPVDPASRRIEARLPNWLRVVMYLAGNNHGPWRELPARIDVPVTIDVHTRQIVAIDVDGAATELADYRRVGRKEWLETEAPLSDVRALFALPAAAVRGLRGALHELRGAAGEIRRLGDSTSPTRQVSAEEWETSRRTATMLRYRLERSPKDFHRVRNSALQAGPMMAANAASGSISASDFDLWLMFQETSGAITADEVAQWRRDAL